jgi:hypothetical protein
MVVKFRGQKLRGVHIHNDEIQVKQADKLNYITKSPSAKCRCRNVIAAIVAKLKLLLANE